MRPVVLTVNGAVHEVEADPATPLIFVLRNRLGLMGAKLGCGLEQCGACAVIVDGGKALSCVRPVSEFEGCAITTIEGLAEGGELNPVQHAFLEAGAAQCGYCTSGLIVALTAYLQAVPRPDRRGAVEALQGHLCRCGAHADVLRAVDRLVAGSGTADGR